MRKRTIRVFRQGSQKYYFRYRFSRYGDVNFPLVENRREAEKIAKRIYSEIASDIDPRLVIRRYHPEHPSIALADQIASTRSRPRLSREALVVGDVLDEHELLEARLEIRPNTAARNRQALVRLILVARNGREGKRMEVTDEDLGFVRRFPVANLDSGILSDFKANYTGVAEGEEAQRRRRAANSTINQARSVFSRHACELFAQRGLMLPDLDGFKRASKFRRTGNERFRPPDGPTIRSVFGLWHLWVRQAANGDDSVRNQVIALTLGLHAGLRRSEAARATGMDLRTEPPGLMVGNSQSEITKTGEETVVPLKPFVLRLLQSLAPKDGGYLIRGNANTRKDRVFRDVARALRDAGVEDARPFHLMRKLFGSWVAQTNGLFEAQVRLGHESPEITYSAYARVRMPPEILELWDRDPLAPDKLRE